MTDETEPRKTLTDRTQIYPGHRETIKEGPRKGQQRDYVVLAQEEIDKGFVRPYRDAYRPSAQSCTSGNVQFRSHDAALNPTGVGEAG